jgi:flagellar biosynthesis activator protein FlaF
MNYAASAYAKTARETAAPRELEALLLLKAAAKLQAVHDDWNGAPRGLNDALMYNRRLWTVFIDAVMRDDNRLPQAIRQNIANLGVFVMGETFALMTKPRPKHLASLIKINRRVAAGLRGKA